jgi:hypothetical protein
LLQSGGDVWDGWIRLTGRNSAWFDVNCFADTDKNTELGMGAIAVSGICATGSAGGASIESFFEAFDGFEESFRGGFTEVVGGIAGELGGQFEMVEQSHVSVFFRGSGLLVHEFWEQQHAKVFDTSHFRACLGMSEACDFDGMQDEIDQGVESFSEWSMLDATDDFRFFESEECSADAVDSIE